MKMSNDLISRSDLLKALEEKVCPEKYGEKCNAFDVINGVLQVLEEQSIVNDVITVAEQLENCPSYATFHYDKEEGTLYEVEAEVRASIVDGVKIQIKPSVDSWVDPGMGDTLTIKDLCGWN